MIRGILSLKTTNRGNANVCTVAERARNMTYRWLDCGRHTFFCGHALTRLEIPLWRGNELWRTDEAGLCIARIAAWDTNAMAQIALDDCLRAGKAQLRCAGPKSRRCAHLQRPIMQGEYTQGVEFAYHTAHAVLYYAVRAAVHVQGVGYAGYARAHEMSRQIANIERITGAL